MADNEFQATQWWQTGVIYQVYPRSFQDSGGDGVGDLPGITARLDYLVSLGIDALWISPFYPSPMADFGYDVSDYTNVDPIFGTLADFDELLHHAHARKLRVILDFVPNHTSDQHPWFLESKSSRTNPKRDWYLWHDPVPYPNLAPGEDQRPTSEQHPNNWMSNFGGSAWQWDEPTKQFYLHSFLREQPDLNWRNPQVRAAIYMAMRFWLDRGVDGFRMDVLWLLIKDAHFRNNPPNPDYHDGLQAIASQLPVYTADQPETHKIVAEMRAVLDAYPDTFPASSSASNSSSESNSLFSNNSVPTSNSSATINSSTMSNSSTTIGLSSRSAAKGSVFSPAQAPTPSARVLIGEIYLPLPELVRYYGLPEHTGTPNLSGANLPFNFHLIQTAWQAGAIAEVIQKYEALLPSGAWPNYVLGNHDQPRLATRIGPQQARLAAMLLLTLRGTPTLYYGDELGMTDVPIAPDQVQDPAEKNEPGKGRGRDPERSPMLWLPKPNAGFTTPEATPWLPLEQDWAAVNANVQSTQPRSMLNLYRKLLQFRRQHDTLHSGGIADIAAEGNILRFRRTGLPGGQSTDFQLLFNLGSDPATTTCAPGTIVLTTILDGEGSSSEATLTLESGEGVLIALD
jgi:alpha-glucosidase